MAKQIRDVDAYIAAAPQEARARLVEMRRIVKSVVPQAEERISYRIPYYKYDGKPLTYFAGFKRHVGLYAVPISAFTRELAGYVTGKGSVRFPLERPLPTGLIKKLLRARLRQIRGGSQRV